MDVLAKFGVEIDPSGAQKGAKAAERAAQDMASGVEKNLGRVEQAGRRSGRAFDGMRVGASRAASVAGGALRGVGDAASVLEPRLMGVTNLLGRMGGAFGRMTSGLNATGKAAGAAGMGFRGLAAGIGAAVAVTGVLAVALGALMAVILPAIVAIKALSAGFGFLKESLNVARAAEQTETAFSVMLGSMHRAKEVIEELRVLSDSTPLAPEEVVDAGRKLLAFGTAADDVADKTRMLGEVSSAVGIRLTELADIYGKAQVQGRLFAEDINQLTGRGIPIIQALADTMGVAGSEVRQLVEDGQVGFPQLEAAFQNMTSTGGQFAGMLEAQSKTFDGLISTIQGKWRALQRTIGEPIRDALKPLLNDVLDLLNKAQSFADQMVPAIKAWAEGLVAGLQVAFESPQGLKLAMEASVDYFFQLMDRVITAAGRVLEREFEIAAHVLGDLVFEAVTNDALFQGLSAVFQDAAAVLGNAVLNAINPLNQFGVGASPFEVKAVENFRAGFMGKERPERLSFMDELGKETREPTAAMNAFGEAVGKQIAQNQAGAIEQAGPPVTAMNRDIIRVAPGLPGGGGKSTGGGRSGGGGSRGDGLSDMQREAQRVIADIQTPEQELDAKIKSLEKLRNAGLLTTEQFSLAMSKAADEHDRAVQAVVDGNERMRRSSQSALQNMLEDWGNVKMQMDELSVAATQSVAGSMTDALTGLTLGTKSAKDAFSEMATSIVQDITRMITQMLVQYAIQQALGIVTGGVSTAAVGAVGAVMHTGGVAGRDGVARKVPASTWSGAQRYHGGGAAGGPSLNAGEVPAILERGETVVTKDQAAAIKGRLGARDAANERQSGQSVTIMNVDDPNRIKEIIQANPDLILNTLNRRLPTLRRMVQPGGGV